MNIELWLIIAKVMLGLSVFCLIASIWIVMQSRRKPQVPQKLCKHEWELMDTYEVDCNNNVEVEINTVRVYQCPHCLEVRRKISRY
jgi:hypothetical protein